jgi:nickel superoxide dismutase
MFHVALRWSLLVCVCVLVLAPDANAHCQVPCGIYDDPARIAQLREDAATIAKAIGQMTELAGKQDVQSINQLTRWIETKEFHATHIIDVVSEYFLTQKVKPVAAGADGRAAYLEMLADHHAVMRAAMTAKQQANEAAVTELQKTIDKLEQHYHQH